MDFFRTLIHRMLAVCQGGPPDGPRSSGSAALPSDAELSHCFFRHRIDREINSTSTKRVHVLLSNRSVYDYINEERIRSLNVLLREIVAVIPLGSSFVNNPNKRRWRKCYCREIEL